MVFCHKAEVTLWVNRHYSPFLDRFFLITNLGGSLVFSIAVIVFILAFKGWSEMLRALCCFAFVSAIVQIIKHLIFPGELRPVAYFEESGLLRLIDGVVQLKTESFPSGHTAAAFAISTYFALSLPKKQLHWLLALAALSVGYARLYLSQHFITDVYTGMMIGVIFTPVIYFLFPHRPQNSARNDQAS